MSFNDPATNDGWAEMQMFQYDLWTDDDARTLAIYYGSVSSASATSPNRVTRLLDESGDVVLEYNVVGGLPTHAEDVLADCLALFGD